MSAPAGSLVSLYYDADRDVRPGDVIRTQTGRCYRVDQARRQERGKHIGRWHLKAVVLDSPPHPGEFLIHPLRWYHR